MSSNLETLEQKSNLWYRATLVFYMGLVITVIITNVTQQFSPLKLVVQLVPLLIFVPGLIHKIHHRTYSWMCFVLLVYFMAYVVEIGSPLMQWTDILGVITTVGLFISAMMAARFIQRWQYYLNNPHELAEQAPQK
ncbi:DUF2069 domain-containing protein [Sessilibacter corallicola]|uniref:DUF2069 domain-containing protein n=1 Tax=Sessilibacter corallicola TaxID=2904075 RepID=A0ABQ0A4G7_9GAMM